MGKKIDPTKNVLALVKAESLRQDGLRESAAELAAVRAEYDARLREGEAARINAIRAVDVGAATILANQVAAAAEALRVQVESARQQTAEGLGIALDPIRKDIQDLRRVQYEEVGGRTNVEESRANSSNRAVWAGALVGAGLFVVAIASIIVTLIIHG